MTSSNLLVRAGGGAKQLLRAVSVGDTRMVSLLLSAGVAIETVDSKRETALYKAAMNGREEVVNQLLAAGVEINKRASNGATPLFIAAMGGQAGIVSRLLRARANADISIMERRNSIIRCSKIRPFCCSWFIIGSRGKPLIKGSKKSIFQLLYRAPLLNASLGRRIQVGPRILPCSF